VPRLTAADGIVAVVLAAGAASRFGGDKLLHPLHGKPLAAHIADTISALNLAHRIAICPPGLSARTELFASRGFEIAENSEPVRGMGSSLALGAQRALQLGSRAMFVCLADMPHITGAHLEQLLAAGHTADVVATIAEGARTPPALFAHNILPELTALSGDRGARDLIQGALTIEASADLVRDYDTHADFAR
jgi:molybdenum cofactor cytidylyltransferase